MHLTTVHIENFRGLADISFELPNPVTVIVGPNAIGKSTVLEAIRLAKAMLVPSFYGEAQQVVNSLGAFIPSLNLLNFEGLVGDAKSSLTITLKISLEPDEVQLVKQRLQHLARLRIRNLLGIASADELALVQYLSSREGQEHFSKILGEMTEGFKNVETSPNLTISLEIDPSTGSVQGKELFHQEVATILVRSLPPSVGLMTYFPADRAMPMGEVNIQLGAGDATAQLHSHLAQPATKYQRLKQHLVNQSLTGAVAAMQQDFGVVFEKLLSGKQLESITLTPQSQLSVNIRELNTNAVFDIDNMSSGEKGLLLTFFLMKRSTAQGGIILLDEPEMHLNPAVCKKIVQFILDEVLDPLNIQAIICTHSPEITAQAYDNPRCTLLHLRSAKDMSPIYPQDKGEVYEALKRLGSQPGDILFSRGSIYVEGDHDEDLLTTGWPERVSGYRMIKLRGRNEVEKEIKTLQLAEKQAKLDTLQCFVFDLDRKPTQLRDSKLVKVQQWDRYCLENFLLDADSIYDACIALNFKSVPSRGTLTTMLQESSASQLEGAIAREVYSTIEPDNPGYRSDLDNLQGYEEIGKGLLARLTSIRDQLSPIEPSPWLVSFKAACHARDLELRQTWREKWNVLANGKRVLNEIYKQVGPTCSELEFKRRIAIEMKVKTTETWRVVDNVLSSALQT